ncbi:MAG: DUF58 domain-containing protein [Vampirovibrionia bacterium]
MIANSNLYFLIFLGLIPLLIVGTLQVGYSLIYPGKFPLTGIEPLILMMVAIYDIVLFIILIIDVVLTIRQDEVVVSREVTEKLSINRYNPVKLFFSNFSAHELVGVVKDDYPDITSYQLTTDGEYIQNHMIKVKLPPSSKGELTYFLKPDYRGDFEFKNINIRYLSRFKLFWKQVKYDYNKSVKVYPDLTGLQELTFKLTRSSEIGETKLRRLGEGTEFSSLKEYIIGDDVRYMDWRATARRDTPIIRTHEVSKDQTIMVLIDAGRMMSTKLSSLSRFDWGINAALSLSLAALTKGDQVGVGVFADTTSLYIPPKRGRVHLKTIIEGVHNLQPSPIEPDYVGVLAKFASLQKKRALIVVITDLVDAIASNSLLTGLAHLTPRHLPFCVTFNDKKVLEFANSQVESYKDVYNQSVSIDFLDQRKQALNTLVRKGGLVLDVPPEDLSTAIVDKYLTIKAKNLL